MNFSIGMHLLTMLQSLEAKREKIVLSEKILKDNILEGAWRFMPVIPATG
jgi:hypothetical protein